MTQYTAESQLIPHACRPTPGVQPDQGKGGYYTAEAIWPVFGEGVITGLKIVEIFHSPISLRAASGISHFCFFGR